MKSRGCRKLKKGNTGVPPWYVDERCEVHLCCTAAAALVPLAAVLRGCFRNSECVGWNCPHIVVFRMARPNNTFTRAHGSTVRSCHENNILHLEVRLLLYRGCHSSVAYDVIQALTAADIVLVAKRAINA